MAPPATEEATIQLAYVVGSDARPQAKGELRRPLKRGFDVAVAAILLFAALPLMLLIAAVIKLDSRGPVFFRVRRVGYRGEPFWMLKFRKMYSDAAGGPLTTTGDPRLTRVGALLRRSRLDELPQLWEVLRGRMSIVGPRPEAPEFVAQHTSDYERILSVRPGMTGITQVAFADESKMLDQLDPVGDYVARLLPQKVELDKRYADCHSLTLDLSVLWWTLVIVVLRRPTSMQRWTCQLSSDEPGGAGRREAPRAGQAA